MDSAQQIFAGLDAPTLAYALAVIFAAAVVRAAVAAHTGMATFGEAGVSGKDG